MTVQSRIATTAKIAARRMADRDTPFLYECWYVAGFAEDFSRELKARTLLGRALVLFRDQAGRPAALDDRCPHRSFPLSRSCLQGDALVCGYHGLRYDRDGRCIDSGGAGGAPIGLSVRTYPLQEQGRLVWIWMGEREPTTEPPLGEWATDEVNWPSSHGYFHLPASYIALHENLLDLTHLTYVHASSFGTPDFASAPYEVQIDADGGRFGVSRTVAPTRLPPVWAEPTGLSGREAARLTRSDFWSPAAHTVQGQYYDYHLAPDQRPDARIWTAHLPTPETQHSCHYFIYHARNFALDVPGATEVMHSRLWGAFEEDVEALTAVEEAVRRVPPDEFYEVSLASDRPGVAMRRWLLAAVERERAAAAE